MTSTPHPGAPRPAPLRLTRRGRTVRNLLAGTVAFGAVEFAQSISVAFFTAVVWASQVIGLSA